MTEMGFRVGLPRDEIRLEVLKLAVTKTSDHQEALLRAERYYDFVVAEVPEKKPDSVGQYEGSLENGTSQKASTQSGTPTILE